MGGTMDDFAELLDRLSLTASRNGKLTLVRDYLRSTPDPDRGWALAALTGELSFTAARPAMIRAAIEARVDPLLFRWSYDFVGDLAETAALIWPANPDRRPNRPPSLAEAIEALCATRRSEAPALIAFWMDALGPKARWAFLKLMTGALRVGLSARLARTAAAGLRADGSVEASDIEELWQGLEPPYVALFAWLEGRGERPAADAPGRFRPVMLATPLDDTGDLGWITPEAFLAEWKWDGIRVQAVREGGVARLWTRTGDEISAAFPDLMAHLPDEAALDGELVVLRDGAVAPFGDLQQRLNRKAASAALMAAHPAGLVAYDLLAQEGEDLRPLPLATRRDRLERLIAAAGEPRLRLSPAVPFRDADHLAELRLTPDVGAAAEGLMLKRLDAPYVGGRPRGPWFKWKRDPHLIDAVMMYAQRGHGRRSSFHSDFTFGVWTADGLLSPVGKAYFGFTDEELARLDRFVRDNTTERFGPVRAVRADREAGLVLEIAFEGLQRSSRHKSGVAMRFPRINRIRWDKPPGEADTLDAVLALLEALERDGGRLDGRR
jgi:DNA ligase 1